MATDPFVTGGSSGVLVHDLTPYSSAQDANDLDSQALLPGHPGLKYGSGIFQRGSPQPPPTEQSDGDGTPRGTVHRRRRWEKVFLAWARSAPASSATDVFLGRSHASRMRPCRWRIQCTCTTTAVRQRKCCGCAIPTVRSDFHLFQGSRRPPRRRSNIATQSEYDFRVRETAGMCLSTCGILVR